MLRDLLRREGPHDWAQASTDPDDAHGDRGAYRKPRTSQRHPAHTVYPYLLRHLEITRSNHVWAADITYIPMKRGFVYLFAVFGLGESRRVLAWRLSNTLTTDFCLDAVQEAITGMAPQPSSIPIKGASSPARSSPDY